jgi:hypothetical protein
MFDEDDLEIFSVTDIRRSGAYFWDDLIENLPAWRNLKYQWIASSSFGDQIMVTENSPLHSGTALYMHGPDVAGPQSEDPNWIENILYLGPSINEWLARVKKFGGEYSIGPGAIHQLGAAADEYRAIYRQLNPGLQW